MARVVHFELPVEDGARAAELCTHMLGRRVERFADQPYPLMQAGVGDEPGANGALVARDALHASPVVVASVPDIDQVLVRVRDRGCDVVQDGLRIPGVGWSASLREPERNLVDLSQRASSATAGAGGDPPDAPDSRR